MGSIFFPLIVADVISSTLTHTLPLKYLVLMTQMPTHKGYLCSFNTYCVTEFETVYGGLVF